VALTNSGNPFHTPSLAVVGAFLVKRVEKEIGEPMTREMMAGCDVRVIRPVPIFDDAGQPQRIRLLRVAGEHVAAKIGRAREVAGLTQRMGED
jgi:hypothetical protein